MKKELRNSFCNGAMTEQSKDINLWVSFHVHSEPPWERLLKEVVQDIIEQSRGVVFSKFFFVRYWEKGPHLRLRYKTNPDKVNVLKELVFNSFRNDFLKNPPSKIAINGNQLIQHGTIIEVPYVPEVIRYGGEHCMSLVEDQFDKSSRIILKLISKNIDSWSYEKAMSYAIILHLTLAYSQGLTVKESHIFFDLISEHWISRSINIDPRARSQSSNYIQLKNEMLEVFNRASSKQQDFIDSLVSSIWTSLAREGRLEEDIMDEWIREMDMFHSEICELQSSNMLTAPDWYAAKKIDIEQSKFDRWAILQSLVHMTNNRLGIHNYDESYLAFLICLGLKSSIGNRA